MYGNDVAVTRYLTMKLLLSIALMLLLTTSAQAQYKDSLKTFRKCVKSFQKHSDFVFIPSGGYMRGTNDSDLPTPDMNGNYFRNYTVSIDSFFMQKYEVSNAQYLEFLNETMKGDPGVGKQMLPDTLVWRGPTIKFGEPYVEYYFRHPAYANFPVVGVSYAQAVAYAEWKTEQYNKEEDRVFKKVRFRIPTEEEWEYAVNGGERGYLPWEEPNTIDENGRARANFLMVSQLGVYRDTFPTKVPYRSISETAKNKAYVISTGSRFHTRKKNKKDPDYWYENDLLRPVDFYGPNTFGLYNMAGNVEEMVDAYYLRDPAFYSFSHDYRLYKHDKPWGVTKGGSWNDPGYYLHYPVRQFYENEHSSSPQMGFRLVMEVLEY